MVRNPFGEKITKKGPFGYTVTEKRTFRGPLTSIGLLPDISSVTFRKGNVAISTNSAFPNQLTIRRGNKNTALFEAPRGENPPASIIRSALKNPSRFERINALKDRLTNSDTSINERDLRELGRRIDKKPKAEKVLKSFLLKRIEAKKKEKQKMMKNKTKPASANGIDVSGTPRRVR